MANDATSAKRRSALVSLRCAACGTGFQRYPSQLKHGLAADYYCSRDCANLGNRTASVVQCAMCDEPFVKARAEQDSERHFCSLSCYKAWRAANRSDTYPKAGARHRHRIVAESVLGRPLRPGEVVHHIDEDKSNYAVENLAVFPSQSHHMRCHGGGMSAEELASYSLANGAPAL